MTDKLTHCLISMSTPAAEAAAGLANNQAAAVVTYTAACGTANVQLATSTSSDQQTYNQADVGFQNSRRDAQVQADMNRSVAYAQADHQHAIDMAQAQEDYQVAINSPLPAGEGQGVRERRPRPISRPPRPRPTRAVTTRCFVTLLSASAAASFPLSPSRQ